MLGGADMIAPPPTVPAKGGPRGMGCRLGTRGMGALHGVATYMQGC